MGGLEIVPSTNDLEQGPAQSGNYNQGQHEMWNVPRSEYYERFVKENLQCRPWLESLDQFMNPSALGFAVNPKRRMLHFDIKVIHISKSGSIESITKCLTPTEFKEAISEEEPKERSGTIIIAKDLSQAMINSLGMNYELEPELFASHLEGTEYFRMGIWESPTVRPPARAPNFLPDYLKKASFYTAEYRRPYHMKGGRQEIFKLRSTETNTARGVFVFKYDIPDIFVSEKISVYKKPGSNVGKLDCLITGILLRAQRGLICHVCSRDHSYRSPPFKRSACLLY